MLNITSIKGRLRGQQGFTLLELLIVLLIIGILIAIGLYRYQSVVDAANAQEAKAEVRAAFISVSAAELSGPALSMNSNQTLDDGLSSVAMDFRITAATPQVAGDVGSASKTVYSTMGADNTGAATSDWVVAKDDGNSILCMGTVDGDVVSGALAGGNTADLTCDGTVVVDNT